MSSSEKRRRRGKNIVEGDEGNSFLNAFYLLVKADISLNLPSRAEVSVPGNNYIQIYERKNFISSVDRFVNRSNGNGNPEKRTLSGKEIRKLKILRNKLAILWPEMGGLLEKYRIKYKPESSSTEEDMIQDILSIEVEIVLPAIDKGEKTATQRIAKLISLIYSIPSFTQEKIYQLFCSKRFKNRNS